MARKTTKGLNLYFFLNKRSTTTEEDSVLIIADLKYRANQQEYKTRFSTGISCKVKAFNKGTIKNIPAEPEATEKNEALLKIRKEAEKIFRHHKETGKDLPLPERFKDMIIGQQQIIEVERNFITDFQEFIQNKKALGKNYSTINTTERTLELLQNFVEKQNKKHLLRYENINLTFYSQFVEYLRTHHHHKDNTIGKYIKKLKEFLNYALRSGWNKYQYYKLKEFAILESEVEKFFLSEEEIQKIINLDLTNKPHLEKARDLFIVAIETGTDFTDYKKVFDKNNLHEVEGGADIRLNRGKTKTLCIVPASPLLLKILAKYNFSFKTFPTLKTFNLYLKVLRKKAKIEPRTSKDLSAKDLRRSAITRKWNKGYPIQLVMKMVGHKTEREHYKYVGLSPDDFSHLTRKHDTSLNINSNELSEILKNK
jgi:site-specific recombinase XerD